MYQNTNLIELNNLANNNSNKNSNNNATNSTPLVNQNLNSSQLVDDSILFDDLSCMPLLDDRSISNALKVKYDQKRIYVNLKALCLKLLNRILPF